MAQGPDLPGHYEKTSFAAIEDWQNDDHLDALKSFLRFCTFPEGGPEPRYASEVLKRLCPAAREAAASEASARTFLESRFTPYRIAQKGFVTGYYEPEVDASRTRTDVFKVPLLKKPDGLEPVSSDRRPAGWPVNLSHGRRTDGVLSELPDRGAIMDGALADEGLELVWLADPVDAYFIHVQGSARLKLTDGTVMRVGYAGKSGHPYTGIGKLLVDRGEGTPEDFTMSGLRAWLAEHPEERDPLFHENRSYIFFREIQDIDPDQGPIGAAGLPLTPGRSLAVDPKEIPYGSLVFVSASFDDFETADRPFARLMVTDDTGSAIRGRARGDIFVGSGAASGETAGAIRHAAEFIVLVPEPGSPEPGGGVD